MSYQLRPCGCSFGQASCSYCGGQRDKNGVTCRVCNGRGTESCFRCGGAGNISEFVSDSSNGQSYSNSNGSPIYYGGKDDPWELLGGFIALLVIIGLVAGGITYLQKVNRRGRNASNQQKIETTKVSQNTTFAVVTRENGVYLRPKASSQNTSNNSPILNLSYGDKLELISNKHTGEGWYNVKNIKDGKEGWVHGNSIKLE